MAVQQVKPGEFFIQELGRSIRITDVRQDDFYDTVAVAAGAISAGTEVKFFDSISSKNRQHTNITTARRIPGRNRFNLLRVGLHIRQAAGNTLALAADMLKIYDAGALKFNINTRLVTEGPLLKYQSGYGATGQTTENAVSLITLGTANQAAAPKFLAAQPINDQDDLDAAIRFDQVTGWDSAVAMPTTVARSHVSCFLFGIIEKPITT
jgi:hypothetical protein